MKSKTLLCLALVLSGGLFGCAPIPENPDIRVQLLTSARKNDPDFPDGREVMLTHFSYLGRLVTSRGEIIHVADRRAVITGMAAPHGRNSINFFDRKLHFLGKIGYVNSRPLWCDGGKLYLFGDLDGFPEPGRNYSRGNVIDVADGFANLKIYHAKIYGSSGGIEDN
jgi:hypothetical protein